MKNLVKFLLENALAFIKRIPGNTKRPQPIRCKFCGEIGHDVDNCTNASKYKLFNVDRD
jgi:hypothetical protein